MADQSCRAPPSPIRAGAGPPHLRVFVVQTEGLNTEDEILAAISSSFTPQILRSKSQKEVTTPRGGNSFNKAIYDFFASSTGKGTITVYFYNSVEQEKVIGKALIPIEPKEFSDGRTVRKWFPIVSSEPVTSESEQSVEPRVLLEIEVIGVPVENRVMRGKNRLVTEFYEFGEQIGRGSFGEVAKAVDKETGELVAIKTIKIDIGLKNHMKKIKRELGIIQFLHHENIVRFYEYFKTDTNVHLVMELAEGGELLDVIMERGRVTSSETAGYLRQILSGVDYMHQHGIVHRDLTLENLLLDRTKTIVKITDFGVSKNFTRNEKGMKRFVGSLSYLAPEILNSEVYDHSVDIWSVGVITYILLAGYPPFDGPEEADIWKAILLGKLEFFSPDWDDIPDNAKDFIRHILVMDPRKRPSAKHLLGDNWIQSCLPNEFVSPKKNPREGLVLRLGSYNTKLKARKLSVY